MPRPLLCTLLPIPKGWPRRVRSAAVHAISLADIAFIKTLSWAAHGLHPQLRQQAELERFRREIALLREEIRIKDARMEQIEPHRRPYYPPAARLAILELRAARGWSMAQAARTFLVSPLNTRLLYGIYGELSGEPLSTRDPPVRGRDTFGSPSRSVTRTFRGSY